MIEAEVNFDFANWRDKAREYLKSDLNPSEIAWRFAGAETTELLPGFGTLFEAKKTQYSSQAFKVPREFLDRAQHVYAFRADDTAALLYRILWRLKNEEPNLMHISIDDDVREFESRYRLVHRDVHKMKAFVRFREVEDRFIAWHSPDHLCVRLAAPFFVERFNGMNWSILTQDECMHWDQKTLTYTEGVPKSLAPKKDDVEILWKNYYRSIFNPARIKWNAMTKELPVRHWKTLPESEVIHDLIRSAPGRLQDFYREQNPGAEKWLPQIQGREVNLSDLKTALPNCQACGICERANLVVMGEGPQNAEMVFIGEQPGEEEDKQGRPFIGPAGQLLNQAMLQAGLVRDQIYLTNAVKAYKWTDKEGYGRIHRGSSPLEIAACSPWLKKELEIIRPKKIVCLGRSAAQAVLGRSVLMREARGKFFQTPFSDQTLVVPHPSFILRIQDKTLQQAEYEQFVSELRLISV